MDAPALASYLARLAPVYGARPEQVTFLASPAHLFELLTTSIRKAERRVALSSLYLGTEEMERRLVGVLGERLGRERENGRDGPFHAHIHLDYLRGTRGQGAHASSANLLQPLVAAHSPRLQVSMYLTPSLHHLGWRKLLIPPRWNEIFGLSHLKVGIFDDTVLITGANLSQNYFTNRADRYVCIRDHPQLAEYFADLIQTIASFSFRLAPPPAGSSSNDEHGLYFEEPSMPIAKAEGALLAFLKRQQEQKEKEKEKDTDANSPRTILIPSLQMAQHNIRQDEQMLAALLDWLGQNASKECNVALASGYFNLSPFAQQLFCKFPLSSTPWRILTASPQSNSFFGSKGMSRHVPAAYRAIESAFLRSSHRPPLPLNDQGHECVYEYERPGWSFHVKGLWTECRKREGEGDDENTFITTTIGSSNFGHRSWERDLETQLLIATNDPTLAVRIREEREEVFRYGRLVSMADISREGEPSYFVQTIAALFRSFL